jgi:hypothetical protein
LLQDHVCRGGGEGGEAAEYCGQLKGALGERLSQLGTPDDLVAFFASLADSAITHCTSGPEDSPAVGADASSALGLHLRLCCARYAAMPFEVSWQAGGMGGPACNAPYTGWRPSWAGLSRNVEALRQVWDCSVFSLQHATPSRPSPLSPRPACTGHLQAAGRGSCVF